MTEHVFHMAIEILQGGDSAALATLITSQGAPPGGEPHKMLVTSAGTMIGTVGDGRFDVEVWRVAQRVTIIIDICSLVAYTPSTAHSVWSRGQRHALGVCQIPYSAVEREHEAIITAVEAGTGIVIYHPNVAFMVWVRDVVTINYPLHPETEQMFNDRLLAQMKRGAYLVHTARGKICDRDARGGGR